MIVFVLFLLVGVVGIEYTEIITRKPKKGGGYERGFFQDRPELAAALIVAAAVVAMYVRGRFLP